jgi:SAM-dependent methyltransferase
MRDVLAPAPSDIWSDGTVTVTRSASPADPPLAVRRRGTRVLLEHRLTPGDLRDSLALQLAAVAPGPVDEFERMLVGAVRTTVPGAHRAWSTYYRNSLDDLLTGIADFAPIHARAESLLVGESVLDLGSCFGFFALRAARAGYAVTATDLCSGTMTLLAAMAVELDIPLVTRAADAIATGLPDRCADTVTALHLLEHLSEPDGAAVFAEAVRLARRRVVIAVPYEDEPTACYGHLRTFDAAALSALAADSGLPHRVFEHHGGWLVVDLGGQNGGWSPARLHLPRTSVGTTRTPSTTGHSTHAPPPDSVRTTTPATPAADRTTTPPPTTPRESPPR